MKKLIFLFFAITITIAAFAGGVKEKKLDVYYSSSLNGNLDGCDCKGNPRSGLVKRAVYLREVDSNKALILEAGDIFDVYEDKLLSDYILKSYLELGYDAIAMGDQEFSNGVEYLFKTDYRNLFRSDNLSIQLENSNFQNISDKPLVIAKGGLNITVLSIIDPDVFRFYPESITKAVKIEDPSSTLFKVLKEPEIKNSQLIILLYHGSVNKAHELAKVHKQIEIIIVAHDQQKIDGEMEGNTIIVSPGGDGNLLGHLSIQQEDGKNVFINSFISFDYKTDPDDEGIRNRINEYNKIMKGKLQN
jgi:2',3'-cyclic-nucleotide 2'-phosphodiesterase (5'-nucleotidase family)